MYFPITAFEKIRLEAPYHELTNGGHITYVELDGDPLENLDAFESRSPPHERIRQSATAQSTTPSTATPSAATPASSATNAHAADRTEADGKGKFERIRRITGYLVGTLDSFNDAKLAEVRDRVERSVGFRTRGAVNACKPGGGEDAFQSVLPSPAPPSPPVNFIYL